MKILKICLNNLLENKHKKIIIYSKSKYKFVSFDNIVLSKLSILIIVVDYIVDKNKKKNKI